MSKKGAVAASQTGGGAPGGGVPLPSSVTSLTTLPRYDVRKAEDRASWTEEYDRIEKELLQPSLPNGAVLCVRHYDSLALPFQSPPNSERTLSEGYQKLVDPNAPRGQTSASSKLSPTDPSPKSTFLPTLRRLPCTGTNPPSEVQSQRVTRSHQRPQPPPGIRSRSALGAGVSRAMRQDKNALNTNTNTDSQDVSWKVTPNDIAVIHTLLNPRQEFAGNFRLDLSHVNVDWIRRRDEYPFSRDFRTIETLINDRREKMAQTVSSEDTLPTQKKAAIFINSPRSLYTLLIEGVTVPCLLRDPEPRGEDTDEHRMWEELERARLALLERAHQTYHTICGMVSREAAIDAVRKMDEIYVPDTLLQQKNRVDALQRAQHFRAQRLERAELEAKKSLEAMEAHRANIEQDRRDQLLKQKRTMQERSLAQQRHAEELRKQKEIQLEAYAQQLQERRSQLDQRDVMLQEAVKQSRARRSEKMQCIQAKRSEKMKAVRERLSTNMIAMVQTLEEKNELAEKRRASLEERKKSFQEKLKIRRKMIESIRVTVLQKAKEVEAKANEAVQSRHQRAIEHLRQFEEQREQNRQERLIKAKQCDKLRQEVQLRSSQTLEARRSDFSNRMNSMQTQHEVRAREKENHYHELSFRAHVSFELKNLRVQRLRRIEEFNKLIVAHHLQTQSKKIELMQEAQHAKIRASSGNRNRQELSVA